MVSLFSSLISDDNCCDDDPAEDPNFDTKNRVGLFEQEDDNNNKDDEQPVPALGDDNNLDLNRGKEGDRDLDNNADENNDQID